MNTPSNDNSLKQRKTEKDERMFTGPWDDEGCSGQVFREEVSSDDEIEVCSVCKNQIQQKDPLFFCPVRGCYCIMCWESIPTFILPHFPI